MAYVAMLSPVVLLLLMLLLGRLERWLDTTTPPPPPPRPERPRWRRGVRPARSPALRAGRLLPHRAGGRLRAPAPPRASVAVPGAGRRHLLRGRQRSADR